MRIAVAAATAAAFLLPVHSSEAAAQDRPDFSGSWTLSESTGGPQGGAARGQGRGMMMQGIGQTATISQDGSTLTLVRTTPMGEMRSVYNLDGSASPNTMRMGNNAAEVVSTASWDGNALVIVTPLQMGGASGESRMRLTLDDAGQLVVETTRSGGMGGGGTARATYTRG